MSDPVTNIEIEDVLSSIRKLVSQGGEASTRDADPAAGVIHDDSETEQHPAAEPPKLVLTPAFRVQTDDDLDGDTDVAETGTPSYDEHQTPLSDEHTDAEPDPVWRSERSTEDGDEAETDATSAPDFSAEAPQESEQRSRLEATIAELEASVEDNDFEPDGTELPDGASVAAWPGSFERVSDADDATVYPEEAEEWSDVDEDEWDAQDDQADEELDALLEEGARLSEDALRSMVSTIVREELQGPMGERITRNVRKLVRREIFRILNSKEFE